MAGYEALSRFQVGEGKGPGPDRWFAAAHQLGLGAELDAVCLATALARRPDLLANCFLTVNVDPESLLSPVVRRVLAGQGHLGGVVIEITEHRPWDWSLLDGVASRRWRLARSNTVTMAERLNEPRISSPSRCPTSVRASASGGRCAIRLNNATRS